MKTRDFGWLLLLGIIWGAAFLFINIVVDDVPPLTVVAGRMLLAAATLLIVLAATGRRLPARSLWPLLVVLGVINNVLPFALITWSEQHITSSLAATLNATMPLFTFAIAVALAVERPTFDRALGLVVGFGGAVVLLNPSFGDLTSSSALAEFAVIAASACYALATVLARDRLHEGDPLAFAAGQLFAGAIIAIPLALAIDGAPHLHVGAGAALSWVTLGIVCTAVAYVIFFGLVQRISATQVSLVSYIIPVVGTLLGWAALGEHVGWTLIAGLVLILAGLAIVNGTSRTLLDRTLHRESSP
jgi:drug/metabolite transporter (DMT)-like permease